MNIRLALLLVFLVGLSGCAQRITREALDIVF